MTTIEYLSLSTPKRALYKVGHFFKEIPIAIYNFLKRIPLFCVKLFNKIKKPFVFLYETFVYGDYKTRLSYFIFGFGNLAHKEYIKGILYLLFEICFIIYMILMGGPMLSSLGNLGDFASAETPDPNIGINTYKYFDNSFEILLYSIVTIIIILVAIVLWVSSISTAKELQDDSLIGKDGNNMAIIKSLGGKQFHKTLLAIPMFGVVCFTVIPIIFMILIAFTNYDSYHLTPYKLFDWVGFANFDSVFASGGASNNIFFKTFLQVLLWTLIWAFFATFTNYFLGMIVAILINTKGIKLKKIWRTILITTIAVPQFVSLLLMSRMFNQDLGIVNQLLIKMGWITKGIGWLNDSANNALLPKVMIILINTWIGIPYTMLICTGLLMNIPDDLYESAKIDGASPVKMYMKITLPYMLFVTTPYLISQFVGNINNFNVIYLLSGGNPLYTFDPNSVDINTLNNLTGLGRTDLLITWIYKMAMTNTFKDYGVASVLSILIFVVVAVVSLITYSRTNSIKNEEDFQ